MKDSGIKIKESRGGYPILWVFVAVGVAILVAGIAIGAAYFVSFISYAPVVAEVTGVVEGADGKTAVIADYTFDGKEYSGVVIDGADEDAQTGDKIPARSKRRARGAFLCASPPALYAQGLRRAFRRHCARSPRRAYAEK